MYDLESIADDQAAFRACVAANQPYKPLYVKIKLTWRCNLRCQMCNYWRQERRNALTPELLRATIDELAELGCGKIHLSGGEPLLREDLSELIEYMAAKRMRVNLTTNGTLLTREKAGRLAASGVKSISVSIDSPEARVHDRIRGKGAWKRTIKGLRNLRRAIRKARAKTKIRLNTVVSHTNYESLTTLPDLAREVGANSLTLIPVDDPEGKLLLNKRRIRDYNEHIAPVIASRGLEYGLLDSEREAYPFGIEKAEIEQSKRGWYALGLYDEQPCYAPWTHALITPNARVYACCMTRGMPKPLGNLLKAPFTAIWQGETYQAFRARMHGTPLEICRHCDDFLEQNRYLHSLVADGE
ncbi:MAG TPA: radical SAM protein [Anaerolineae bacterium]|nr:radical SAM protein [Anaerolineae bacterium]